MHPFIPEEIVVTILTNLPSDSLARFKCVSKQWCGLISETLNNIRRRKVFTMSWNVDRFYFQSVDRETLELEDVDIPWGEDKDFLRFYGSCNGLLLVESFQDLFLWNPFIHYHQKILSYKDLDLSYFTRSGGLCFDSIKKEYKVVLCLRDTVASKEYVVVGSPRDKSWKHVDFPYGSVHLGSLLNNRLHWLVVNWLWLDDTQDLYPQFLILYFDVGVDEFIELPSPIEVKTFCKKNLGVLDGCLCMTCEEGEQTVKVMAMKEYGVQESWTVLFRLKGENYFRTDAVLPFFYLDGNKNQVLMSLKPSYDYDSIVVYDTNSNSETKLVTMVPCLRDLIIYEETSVKLIGYDWEELDSRGEASYVEIFDSTCQRTMKKDENGNWYDPEESDDKNEEAVIKVKKMAKKVS